MSSTGKNKNFKLKQNRNSKNVKSRSDNTRQSYNKITRKKGKPSQPKQVNKPSVKISFLGGLNEIGKNITLIECENDMVIVDTDLSKVTEPADGKPVSAHANMFRKSGSLGFLGHGDYVEFKNIRIKPIK